MSNIIVTGAAGFLGSHLVKRLSLEGHTILALDAEVSHSRENIDAIKNLPGVTYRTQDILGGVPPHYLHFFGDNSAVDQIYNAACVGSPPQYNKNRRHTYFTSTTGVENLLLLAQEKGARFLQFSTSEVYGDPLVHPQEESNNGNVSPIGPRSPYDEGKRGAETLCCAIYADQVDVRVARIFNTYGPQMHPEDGRVVSNFLMQALAGKPLTVYEPGTQTRSFCYVDDQIEGLTRLMNSDVTGPVNIGNPQEFTILELAELVKELTETDSEIQMIPHKEGGVYHPKNDPQRRQPDITRARELLGWEPQVNLEEGLRRTIPYFREKVEALKEKPVYSNA